jgi:SAM-dependent methyltransferase
MSPIANSLHALIYRKVLPRMLTGHGRGKKVSSHFISIFGRQLFWTSLMAKEFLTLGGVGEDRTAEYPWVCSELRLALATGLLRKGSLVLNVGCSESLLDHEMLAMGYRVVGLDIRDDPWRNRRTLFLKEDILSSSIPDCILDAIVIVSTIEHVGLDAYGQTVIREDGDLMAMKEVSRMLRPGGLVFLTTPFVGAGISAGSSFERQYDPVRLGTLTSRYKVEKEDYFLPMRRGKRWSWAKASIQTANVAMIDGRLKHGLACLVLRKT